ncbi:hypothetical protein Nstercoris_01649 [Nitrosomonas stercoris]|uniref:Na(+)H(+) antiporter subunit G n=1 Tax=Nitrosomonas stercoris TaxID=1444684 RepID=A0A4Y1YMX9_9PROT|nr:hypothetical protein Nstercoris_01649 [Nitrosomonas stercoris]
MNQVTNLPLWATLLIAAFLIIGAILTLIGSFGLYHLRSFYDRIHTSTLGTSWGTAAIVIASIVYFSITESELVLHPFLIGAFIIFIAPVALILLSRAALYRDRAANNPEVPSLKLPANTTTTQSAETQLTADSKKAADT